MHIAMATSSANWASLLQNHLHSEQKRGRKGLKTALLYHVHSLSLKLTHTEASSTTGVVSYSAELTLFGHRGSVALKESRGDGGEETGVEQGRLRFMHADVTVAI
ncbi:hypothetical protein CHARACLAT_028482 [Characodon lateralis]|uniref:Uncharacterized protein n=1 Tax=Characodon lateralis TaxID=208331 RepID=A0ABU7E4A8_9TELE|nr:hypothetical protein [Characodon lateralis]